MLQHPWVARNVRNQTKHVRVYFCGVSQRHAALHQGSRSVEMPQLDELDFRVGASLSHRSKGYSSDTSNRLQTEFARLRADMLAVPSRRGGVLFICRYPLRPARLFPGSGYQCATSQGEGWEQTLNSKCRSEATLNYTPVTLNGLGVTV